MAAKKKKRVSQAQQRGQRLGARKVTKQEAATNPVERGRAGLTRLTRIGAQGVFDDIQRSGGTFTLPDPNAVRNQMRKSRRGRGR